VLTILTVKKLPFYINLQLPWPWTDVLVQPKRWKRDIGFFRKWDGGGGMDWIDLAQDRGRWQAVLNAVMNLRVL